MVLSGDNKAQSYLEEGSNGKCFVIMQIGDEEMDKVFHDVITPVGIEIFGEKPKRIDVDNDGDLLIKEIMSSIDEADIIIADLTNERPNCYLEVGYALGVDKIKNTILMVREDHNPESPNYTGKKVHFDLSGYDILFWDSEEPDEFRNKLNEKIKKRINQIKSSTSQISNKDKLSNISVLKETRIGMSVSMVVDDNQERCSRDDLLKAAKKASEGFPQYSICYFGDEKVGNPKPLKDGITAKYFNENGMKHIWSLHENLSFIASSTHFEDAEGGRNFYCEERVVSICEVFVFMYRLYSIFKVPKDNRIIIRISYKDLADRRLMRNSEQEMPEEKVCIEDDIEFEREITLSQFGIRCDDLIIEIASELFYLFEYFELGKNVFNILIDSTFREYRIPK